MRGQPSYIHASSVLRTHTLVATSLLRTWRSPESSKCGGNPPTYTLHSEYGETVHTHTHTHTRTQTKYPTYPLGTMWKLGGCPISEEEMNLRSENGWTIDLQPHTVTTDTHDDDDSWVKHISLLTVSVLTIPWRAKRTTPPSVYK